MAAKPLALSVMRETLDAYERHQRSRQNAAAELGLSVPTFESRLKAARVAEQLGRLAPKPFDIPELPNTHIDIDELIAQRLKKFSQKATAKDARKLIPVRIKETGPFGVAIFGDPHVDDDGTDLRTLKAHLDIVARTPGLVCGQIGDVNNNWDGRLMKLWAEQSTSADEAWGLAEWFLRSVTWLFWVKGNHDAWSQSRDPIQRLAQELDVLYDNQVRIALTTPKGREIRLNARHDFRGHSMWNSAHGVSKAAQMGWRDHVLVCGHTHQSGYQHLRDPMTRLISHAIRVGSYKTFDRYADQLGLPDQTVTVCPVIVFQPRYGDDDPRLITVFNDPEVGADFLTFLRKKKAA